MVDYHFEEVQHFKVVVYDVDDKAKIDDLEKHDFLGEADLKLANVLTAGKALTKPLMKYSSGKYIYCVLKNIQITLYSKSIFLYKLYDHICSTYIHIFA